MKGEPPRILASPRAPAVIIALALALVLPSVTAGLTADDWIQKLIAVGPHLDGLERGRLDLFTFADGNAAHARALVDHGVYPWWTDPEVKLSFFRPLTALTHIFDWRLFPAQPWLMHLHNLLWFALALLAVAYVYRRLLAPPALATLALLLFAVDDHHGLAIGWVANRNALVALALALPALALHDRHRREGWTPAAWLGPACLALGLCAGEAALAVAAYLVAWALTLDEGSIAQRLGRLWRYGVVVLGWHFYYHWSGWGAARSGVYLDPAAHDLDFWRALPARAASLLVGQFALPWSDFAPMWGVISPRLARAMTIYSYVVVALLAWLFWPTIKRHAVARFFALGLILSTVPVCATFPADRLLWFVGIGAMGLVACLITDEPRGARRVGAWAMIALHVVLAPPLLAVRSRSIVTIDKPLERVDRTIPTDVTDKTVVLMNPPADVFAGYVQFTRAARGEPRPARLRWLATGAEGVELTREDATTLRVRQIGGFNRNVSERMLRSPRHALAAGQRIDIAGMHVEMLAFDEARIRFDVPLEDPSLVWLRWQAPVGYVPAAPPPVGERLSLPPIDVIAATFEKRDK